MDENMRWLWSINTVFIALIWWAVVVKPFFKDVHFPKINLRCLFGHEWSAEVIKEGDVVTAKLSCSRCGKKLA